MTGEPISFFRLRRWRQGDRRQRELRGNPADTSSKQGVLDHIRAGALAVREGCEFEVTGPPDVRVAKGRFASGGVHMSTPAGKVKHTRTTCVVEIDDGGAAVVEVVDGAMQIETV